MSEQLCKPRLLFKGTFSFFFFFFPGLLWVCFFFFPCVCVCVWRFVARPKLLKAVGYIGIGMDNIIFYFNRMPFSTASLLGSSSIVKFLFMFLRFDPVVFQS